MGNVWMDLRFGARMLFRRPGFSAMVVLMLALGIGINTAIFSVFHAVLLRPLPYPQAERLVKLWEADARFGGRHQRCREKEAWRGSIPTFLGIALPLRYGGIRRAEAQERAPREPHLHGTVPAGPAPE